MSVDVDFKRQREISEILRCNNPIAKVLSSRDEHFVPEAHLLLFAPNQLSRDKDGNLRSVPFSIVNSNSRTSISVINDHPTGAASSAEDKKLQENSNTGKKVQFGENNTVAASSTGGSVAGGIDRSVSPFPVASSTVTPQPILRRRGSNLHGPPNDDDNDDEEFVISTSKDFASLVISERKLLAVKNSRKQHLLKRSLQKELVASQLRVKTCRNGGAHPCKPSAAEFASYNNPMGCSSSPIPMLMNASVTSIDMTPAGTTAGSKSKNASLTIMPNSTSNNNKPFLVAEESTPELGTLGGELDKENYFASLDEDGGHQEDDGGGGLVTVSSFFFTQPDQPPLPLSDQPQWTATHAPLALPPITAYTSKGASGTPKIPISERSAESNEALQQKRRDEYLRFKDVSCSRILARDYTPEVDAAAGVAGTSTSQQGRGSSSAARAESVSPGESSNRRRDTKNAGAAPRSLSVIPTPKLIHSVGGAKLPPIEGYSNLMCSSYKESDTFLSNCLTQIERRNADRKKKYLKKFAALNLGQHLPFHATANAILHHVERLIIKEDRESTWREEHDAVLKLFREIERYCKEHYSNPQSMELLKEARCIIVDEQTVPEAPMYNARLMRLLPPTSFLLDEVVTVASHLATLFKVSKVEAIECIRQRAASFVEDHTIELESQLNRASSGTGGYTVDPQEPLLGERPFGDDSDESDADDPFVQQTGVYGEKQ